MTESTTVGKVIEESKDPTFEIIWEAMMESRRKQDESYARTEKEIAGLKKRDREQNHGIGSRVND